MASFDLQVKLPPFFMPPDIPQAYGTEKLIVAFPWIWVLIIYQTKDILQEFRTKGI